MQEELLKRGNKLGFKPGTAGQAVLNKLTDPKQGILVQGLVDRLPGRKLYLVMLDLYQTAYSYLQRIKVEIYTISTLILI